MHIWETELSLYSLAFMYIKYAINFIGGEIPSKNVAYSYELRVSVQLCSFYFLKSQIGHVYEL